MAPSKIKRNGMPKRLKSSRVKRAERHERYLRYLMASLKVGAQFIPVFRYQEKRWFSKKVEKRLKHKKIDKVGMSRRFLISASS